MYIKQFESVADFEKKRKHADDRPQSENLAPHGVIHGVMRVLVFFKKICIEEGEA